MTFDGSALSSGLPIANAAGDGSVETENPREQASQSESQNRPDEAAGQRGGETQLIRPQRVGGSDIRPMKLKAKPRMLQRECCAPPLS